MGTVFNYLQNPPKEILSVIGLCLDIAGFLMLGIEVIASDKFFELYQREETKIANGQRKQNRAKGTLTYHSNKLFSALIFFFLILFAFFYYLQQFSAIGRFVLSFLVFIPAYWLFNFIEHRKFNFLSKHILTKPLFFFCELLMIPVLLLRVVILFIPEFIITPILLKWYLKAHSVREQEERSFFKRTAFYGISLVVFGFIFQIVYYII